MFNNLMRVYYQELVNTIDDIITSRSDKAEETEETFELEWSLISQENPISPRTLNIADMEFYQNWLISTIDKKAIGKTYNLGYGKTTKIIDLAKMIIELLNLTNKTIITTTNVSWQGDVDTIWFDISKAKNELNWIPKITLEDSVKEIIRNWRKER